MVSIKLYLNQTGADKSEMNRTRANYFNSNQLKPNLGTPTILELNLSDLQ